MNAPDLSADWYRSITGFAEGSPAWVRTLAEVGTDAGLVLFAALMVVGWWRVRGAAPHRLLPALVAPLATVGAYLISEISKEWLQEERPCRAVSGVVTLVACPDVGDWSFPSNHATIAAAAAAAITVAWRRMAVLVFPLAAIMAFSRVFVGVHYPHDVAAGFAVGVTAATLLALGLTRLLHPFGDRLRFPVRRPGQIGQIGQIGRIGRAGQAEGVLDNDPPGAMVASGIEPAAAARQVDRPAPQASSTRPAS